MNGREIGERACRGISRLATTVSPRRLVASFCRCVHDRAVRRTCGSSFRPDAVQLTLDGIFNSGKPHCNTAPVCRLICSLRNSRQILTLADCAARDEPSRRSGVVLSMQATDASRVRVRAGARLHLGLLDLSGESGRLYGGVGCMLEEPFVEMWGSRATRCNSAASMPRTNSPCPWLGSWRRSRQFSMPSPFS